jgi:hypothetical protein
MSSNLSTDHPSVGLNEIRKLLVVLAKEMRGRLPNNSSVQVPDSGAAGPDM